MTSPSPSFPGGLSHFYAGWRDFQNLIVAAIEPLTEEQLTLRVAPHQSPVWYLAAHILGTRVGWFMRMDEADAEYLRFEPWDYDDAPPRTKPELLEGLKATWTMIEQRLERWTPEMLADVFPGNPEEGSKDRTRGWILYHLLEHDIYHGGEISLTLGSFGAKGLDL